MNSMTLSFAAKNATTGLSPFQFERRALQPTDVQIEILYCGVCHSDIHQVRNEWGGSKYPMVPGHEIVGRVAAVGTDVRHFKVGELAGVGCMVNSCQTCSSCQEGLEQYCEKGFIGTYNSTDKDGSITYGGYSNQIVVDQKFTLHISDKLDLSQVAPLLCAGVTTYSPLRHWKVRAGQKVGIVGLGGLGHMAVKFSRSFGAQTVVFTTSENKIADAKRLGAHEVVLSKQRSQMNQHLASFDFILDTVSAKHDYGAYLQLLKRDGTMVVVGLPTEAPQVHPGPLIMKRRQLGGSLIGGIKETQEMLDYCAEHNITCDVEVIPIQKINEAFDRTVKSDVKYRFVIDMKSLKS